MLIRPAMDVGWNNESGLRSRNMISNVIFRTCLFLFYLFSIESERITFVFAEYGISLGKSSNTFRCFLIILLSRTIMY